jgi:hypothetical protein
MVDIAPQLLQCPFRSPPIMYRLKPSGRCFSFFEIITEYEIRQARTHLLQIRSNRFNKPVRSNCLFRTGLLVRIQYVKSDLIFQKLNHQRVHGASG